MKKKKIKIKYYQPSPVNYKLINICDKIIEYGIYGIVFLTPIIFCLKTYDQFELPKMILLFNITLFTLTAWIVKLLEMNKITFVNTNIFLASILFLLVLIISTATSKSTPFALYGAYRMYQGIFVLLSCIILYIIVINNFRTSKIINLLLLIILSGTLVATYGIFQRYGYDFLFDKTSSMGGRIASFLWIPTFLGNFLAMCLPISIMLFIKFSSTFVKTSLFTSTVVMFLCLLFTYSRGAWLGFMGSIILIVILLYPLRKEINKYNLRWLASLSIIIILLPIIFSNQEAISLNKTTTLSERATSVANLNEPAIKARIGIWESTLKIIKDYPVLGIGLDCTEVVFHKYQPPNFVEFEGALTVTTKPHNEILQIASTAGFVGLFGWLFLLANVFIKGIKFLRKSQDRTMSFIITGILCSLFAHFVCMQFNFNVITTGMLFWVYIGIIDVLCSKREYELEIKTTKNLKVVIYILISIMFIIGITFINRPILADYYFNKGLLILSGDNSNYKKALPYLKKATKINPLVGEYHFRAGYLYQQYLQDGNSAKKEYLIALKFRPNDPHLLFNLGYLYNEGKEYNKSIYYLEKSAKILKVVNPKDYAVYYFLGLSYREKGLLNKAINSFKKCININPNFTEGHFDLAMTYYLKGQNKDAIKHFKKVIILNPGTKIAQKAKEAINSILAGD